jgi:hypothetical protein
MIDLGQFNLGSIAIPVTMETSMLSIDLHLSTEAHLSSGCPISGFPRNLSDGEPLKRAGKQKTCYLCFDIALTQDTSLASFAQSVKALLDSPKAQ